MSTSENPHMISATDVFWLRPEARRGQLILKFRDQDSPWFSIDAWRTLFRGERAPDAPLVCDRAGGSRAVDFVAGGSVEIRFMSPRMIEVLRSHGFTGWQTWPAEVHGKDGVLLPGYEGLAVTGRCGDLRLESLSLEEACSRRWGKSGYFVKLDATWYDLTKWSGHDVFTPAGVNMVFVTRRVHDALRRSKLTGIGLEPLVDVAVYVPVDRLPGQLRDLVRER